MATVQAHYANHLVPIYLWMVGGMEAALNAGTADLASWLPGRGVAVDLGAGFGMHSSRICWICANWSPSRRT